MANGGHHPKPATKAKPGAGKPAGDKKSPKKPTPKR